MSKDIKSNVQEMPEVQSELSKISANSKQSIAILVIICLVFAGLFYVFFIKETKTTIKVQNVPAGVIKPITDISNDIPSIPKIPEVPKIEAPVIPIVSLPKLPSPKPNIILPVQQETATPKLPELTTTQQPALQTLPPKLYDKNIDQRKETKNKSSVILIAGSAPMQSLEEIEKDVNFTLRGDLNCILSKGKIIKAVLETAINTDLVSEIRAIVTRDVFSEQGKQILIPKGSRVFGSYSADTVEGRIIIKWFRIDIPNGYSLNLDGDAVDNLGRKGEQGRYDAKFKERFTNAVLVSAFSIGVAKGLDAIVPPVTNAQSSDANKALATQIQSTAFSIYNMPNITDDVKFNQVCLLIPQAITDKTSQAFTIISQACSQIAVNTTPAQKLAAVMAAVNNASASLLTNFANVTPTQSQQASIDAYNNITNMTKDFISGQKFNPSTTINQGEIINIYVNKDYKFPKSIVNNTRILH
jgi:type IV secretion system protein VirB10